MVKDSPADLHALLASLPLVQSFQTRCEADLYGASRLVAKEIGIPFPPTSVAGWKHGWLWGQLKHKEQITGVSRHEKRFLVARREHAQFLLTRRLSAKAVGMPFVYMEDLVQQPVRRISKSLLVMPPHSLPSTTHSWRESAYIKQIDDVRDQFDLVVACVHQSCVAKGLWIGTLEERGIPWITGADALDKNSLLRMYKIFKSFEYMTTNAIGSHIPYAAFSGCRVSLFGDFPKYVGADFANQPIYKQFPFLLKHNLQLNDFEYIRDQFPFLFVAPAEATQELVWGQVQLGSENKVSMYALARHLGWLPHDQFRFFGRRAIKRLRKELKGLREES